MHLTCSSLHCYSFMKKSWGFTAIPDLHWDLTPKGSSFQDVSSRYHELMTWHQATTLEAEHQNDAQRGAISAISLLAGPWSEKPGAVRDSFVKTYFYLLICSQKSDKYWCHFFIKSHHSLFGVQGCEFMSTLILIFHWAWSLIPEWPGPYWHWIQPNLQLDHRNLRGFPGFNWFDQKAEANIRKRHVISQEPT